MRRAKKKFEQSCKYPIPEDLALDYLDADQNNNVTVLRLIEDIAKLRARETELANMTEADRNQEFANLDEEIALIKGMTILLSTEPGDLTTSAYKRILSRLKAERDSMRLGFK